jgi:hypothetical protein
MRKSILAAKQNCRTLVQWKQTQRMHKVVSQTRIGHLGIPLGLKLFVIDSDKFLASPCVFPKTIVSNAIKPGRKTGFTPKAADVFICSQESVLGEVIRERDIGAGKLAQETSHTGLMPSHQFAKCVLIVIDKDSRDEVSIGQLHSRRLRYRRHIVLLSLQLPHQEITRANQERNKPDAPCTALPVVHGGKE